MNKITRMLYAGIFIMMPALMMAQSLVVTTDAKGRMGYKDSSTGEIKVKCIYDYAEPFDQYGLAKVGKGGVYGLMKQDGTFVLPMKYSTIDSRCPGNLTRVQSGKAYGLINPETGQIVLPVQYGYVSRFNCYGLAWIMEGGKVITAEGKQGIINGKMGVINKEGQILVTPKYRGLFEFSNKTEWGKQNVYGDAKLLALFGQWLADTLQTDCKYLGFTNNAMSTKFAGVMDGQGNELVAMGLYTWVSMPMNGMMRYWLEKGGKTTYGYHVMATNTTSPCQTVKQKIAAITYITHGDFHGDIAPVNSIEGWYFINKNMQTQKSGFSSTQYQAGATEDDSFWAGIAPGKSVVYKANGTELTGLQGFDNVQLPNIENGDDKYISVSKGGKWGLYDLDGKELIAPQYDYLTPSYFGFCFNKVGSQWGAVDVHGKALIPAQYSDLIAPTKECTSNIWVRAASSDSLYYNYDVRKRQTLPGKYVYVTKFIDGKAFVNPLKDGTVKTGMYDDACIVVDKDNKVIFDKPCPIQFEQDVRDYIEKHKGKISSSEANKFVLGITRGIVRYDLKGVVPDTGWDY